MQSVYIARESFCNSKKCINAVAGTSALMCTARKTSQTGPSKWIQSLTGSSPSTRQKRADVASSCQRNG